MPVVKMAISLAAANFSYGPGDLIMVSPEVAEEWIRIGHATAHEEQPAVKVADLGKDSEPEPDAEPEPVADPEAEPEPEPEPELEPAAEPAAPKPRTRRR